MRGRLLLLILFFPLFGRAGVGLDGFYRVDQHWVSQSDNGEQFLTLGQLYLEGLREWRGFSVGYSLLGSHGGHSPSFDVGDAQIVSNIDTEGVESIKVYEFWISHLQSDIEFSVGWRDLSKNFNVTDVAQLLINSSFGTTAEWGSTGFRGPSIYPVVGFGVHSWIQLSDQLYWGTSITDPLTPENFYPKQMQTHILLNEKNHMAVSELGLKVDQKFHFALGVWNMEQDYRSGRPRYQQAGGYAMLSASAEKGMTPFLRYGFANKRVGSIYENRVFGVNIPSVFAKRRRDSVSAGWSEALVGGIEKSEKVYEILYHYLLTPRTSLALSGQWIIDPSFANTDAQVTTLRLQIGR